MDRRPPIPTPPHTRFPYTTPFRSGPSTGDGVRPDPADPAHAGADRQPVLRTGPEPASASRRDPRDDPQIADRRRLRGRDGAPYRGVLGSRCTDHLKSRRLQKSYAERTSLVEGKGGSVRVDTGGHGLIKKKKK